MFQRARIKLTAWYLVIIMAVSIAFSAVIYRAVSLEVERFSRIQHFRIERRFVEDPEIVNEVKHRMLTVLALINGSIFILSGLLGYMLAGRTLKPIADMVEEQNRFISDSSHELRTPLTSLKSAIEVGLRDKSLTLPEAKTLLTESIGDVNKLVSLTNSLLALSQYQKPSGVVMKKVSTSDIVTSAVKKIEPLAKKKRIHISTDLSNVSIQGDRYGLTDLLIILLDNAIKYSPNGKTVFVNVRKTDGSVVIAVRDNGIGIAKADIPHVFDRFYRSDTARSEKSGSGFGLGLSIAKKIVDMHHGTIRVESEIKKGSTFSVKFQI